MEGSAGSDAAAADVAEVERTLAALAAATAALRNVHDVRMRDTGDGRIVIFHCDVDSARTVSEVHELVDELERGLRRRFPTIKRVIGHAEPRA
jgi:divalent metal cation (Fe/Co/Zn/Cd) transporter